MAQISYGTITIIDTTDIERIYPVYCKGDETNTPSLQPLTDWSENVNQAGGSGNYIWQRIVTKKQGVAVTANDYSDAVRLTGDDGISLTITSIQYAQTQNENDTPSYGNSMPSPINEGWWLWIKTTYSDSNSVVTKIKQGQKGDTGISVTGTKEIYFLKRTTDNIPTAPADGVTTTSTSTAGGIWTTVVPNYIEGGVYYTSIQTTYSGGTSPKSSTAVINQGLTDANAKALSAYNTSTARDTEVNALKAQAKHFWWDSEGAHIAAGQNTTSVDNITQGQPDTYTFNALTAPGFLKLRYKNIDFAQLATNSLTFYRPAVNGSTYVQGKKGMDLTADALTFYKPLAYNSSNEPTAAATLNTNGLVLSEGGVKGGTVGQSGFIYLSTQNYGSNLTINEHQASNWREIIGTKFGVDADGNLYAANAEISGKIVATSLTIGSEATVSGLSTSDISGMDNYALQSSLDTEVAQRKAVYAVSTTGATTAAKTTESGTPAGFVLYNGATVTVKFNSANSTTTPTLNVNGTGAKTIKSYTGAALSAAEYTWPAGAAITFTYDGSYWCMQDGGALQAKADAVASASAASGSATSASNSASAASSSASSASSSATTATNQANAAAGSATAASNSATAASGSATAASNSATAASNSATAALNSATAASNSATAAAEVMGGFTILWNYSAFGTSTAGDAFICGFDPATGTKSDANGWVKWNGTKRTITKQQVNPGTIVPYNIPIYIVYRLSSATDTTGTNYMVWYNSGWKYAVCPSPTAVSGSWTWTDNRDIILGSFVETGANEVLTECELFNPPWTSKQITTNTTTPTSYITDIDSNKGITVKPKDSSGNDFLQMNSTAIEFFRNSTTTSVMRLTDSSFRLGLEASNHTTIDTNGLHIWVGTENTATNEIALFSSTARIGKTNSSRFLIDTTKLQAYNSSNKLYFEVSDSGIKYGTDLSSTSTTTIVASTEYADDKASAAQTAAEATAQGYANIAEANASYSIEVKITAINYTDSSATLVAVPYYQGSTTLPTLPNEASYSYQWYRGTTALSNTSTAPTISGATTATLVLGQGSNLETTYVCVISKP